MAGSTGRAFIATFATFRTHWLAAMSGGVSVPFTALTVFLDNKWAQLIFCCLAFVAVWVAAYRIWKPERERVLVLEKQLEPKLKCGGLTVWNNDGELFARVKIENFSGINISDVKPYLEEIICDDPIRQMQGIDLPLPLYSQERYRERRMELSNDPAHPIAVSRDQPKWLEIFQFTHAIDPSVHLILAKGRADLIPIPRMEFKCAVYGAGPKLSFTVLYEESDLPDHTNMPYKTRISLIDAKGKTQASWENGSFQEDLRIHPRKSSVPEVG
jgi:hypothetical protein